MKAEGLTHPKEVCAFNSTGTEFMQIDQTTLNDLSIFHREDEHALFHKIDHTRTVEGRMVLQHIFHHPLDNKKEILEVQQILHHIANNINQWPERITNGTLLVIEKFLDDNPDEIPERPDPVKAILYKWLHPADHSMIQFSMRQFFEFIKGFDEVHHFFSGPQRPPMLDVVLQQTEHILADRRISGLKAKQTFSDLSRSEILQYARLFHVDMIASIRKLISLYGKLDAWYAMAKANQYLGLQAPQIIEADEPMISAKSLWHLMLSHPVSYDLEMDRSQNFIFLTGANMAGKSTLIKSVGLAVYLTHLGMGVPAKHMQLTLFEGILSNINVEDNITKGESYFFNEVKRIRETISRISDGKRWLVLIDEMFKGTNIQDAMKCSLAVIEGLVKFPKGLFILSTHLYEIGEELKKLSSINFKYFETILEGEQLHFSYQLKDGISQDRMGYLILKKEGVIDLLDRIGK
ncbi:MAG: MutS-related protein [Chitinophagia bacterium]